MSEHLSAFFYLIASVCFILALRGLSSPVTARVGNIYGIAGMLIAVVTTLLTPHVVSFWLIILGILIGGTIGTFVALRIQMTALPQLVAAFHSLVGLAAVCVAAAAFTYPELYGIGVRGSIHGSSLVEMALGMAIGAITFTGSVRRLRQIAGPRHRPAIGLPGAASGQRRARRAADFADRALRLDRSGARLLAAPLGVVGARLSADRADRRGRHAGRDLDAELVLGMGRCRHRLYSVEQPPDRDRGSRRLVGRDPQLHHVQGHEPLNLQCGPGRVRHRRRHGCRGGRRRRPVRSMRRCRRPRPSPGGWRL